MRSIWIACLCMLVSVQLSAQDWSLSFLGGIQTTRIQDHMAERSMLISTSNMSSTYYYFVASEFKPKVGGTASGRISRSLGKRWSIQHTLSLDFLSYNCKTSRDFGNGILSASPPDSPVRYTHGTGLYYFSYTYDRDEQGNIRYTSEGYPLFVSEGQQEHDQYKHRRAGNTHLLSLAHQVGVSYQVHERVGLQAGGGLAHRIYSQRREGVVEWRQLHPEYPDQYRQGVFVTSKDRSGNGFRPIFATLYLACSYTLRPDLAVSLTAQQYLTNLYESTYQDVSSTIPGEAYPLSLQLGIQYTVKRW